MRAPRGQVSELCSRLAGLAAGRGLGLWLAAFVAGLQLPLPPVPAAAALLACVAALFIPRRRAGAVFFSLVLACGLLAGTARGAAQREKLEKGRALERFVGEDGIRLLMRVDEDPERHAGYTVLWGTVLTVRTSETAAPEHGRIKLTVNAPLPLISYGDLLAARVSIRLPRDFANPGAFAYVEYLGRRGCAVTGYVRSADLIVKVEGGLTGPRARLAKLRASYISWLGRAGGEGGALLRALLAGDRDAISRDTQDLFAGLGLAHLLSISGLHLGLVATFVFFLARHTLGRAPRVLERVPAKRIAALATIPAVIIYALLSGMRVPTQRALIMVLTYLLAIVLDRERETWNAFALAAFLVLFIWPSAMFEASFQLSFGCIAGILYVWPRLRAIAQGNLREDEEEIKRLESVFLADRKSRLRLMLDYLLQCLGISLITYWSILPLLLACFHEANPLSPLFNLIAVPYTGLIIVPAGLAGSALGAIAPGPALYFIKAVASAAGLLIGILQAASEAAPPALALPPMTAAGVVSWYLGGIAVLEGLMLWRTGFTSWRFFGPRLTRLRALKLWPALRGNRLAGGTIIGLAAILMAGALGGLFFPRDYFGGGAAVAAFDVGQGQSILVRTANGKNILCDGGGFQLSEFDPGQMVVAPALLEMGIRRLDVVALSHGHPDHGGGLRYILQRFDVGEFWAGPDGDELTDELIAIARPRGIPVRRFAESDDFEFFGAKVRCLHPPRGGFGGEDLNERSLVLRIETGGVRVLLTGDAEMETERRLLERYGASGDLRSEVMTVPHHGSRSSSSPAFIAAVSPAYALASAGGADFMGLPVEEVLDLYARAGVKVLRTDKMGFVAVVFSESGAQLISTGEKP